MDLETAQTVERLVRMIDNVNERNALGQLALNGVVVLLASARRQGTLNQVETNMIEETFADLGKDVAAMPYEKVQRLFENARAVWDASATA